MQYSNHNAMCILRLSHVMITGVTHEQPSSPQQQKQNVTADKEEEDQHMITIPPESPVNHSILRAGSFQYEIFFFK